MPLVVPGIMANGDKNQDWSNKLVGKKIGDAHDEIVSSFIFILSLGVERRGNSSKEEEG